MRALIVMVILSAWISGCASTSVPTELPKMPESNVIGEYIIGVGDELQVNVWKNPELSLPVMVRPDGKISMPLLGDVEAQGMTAKALAMNLTQHLETYIRSPQVNVIVRGADSVDYLLRVRVTGAVDRPLSIPHKDGMTVLDLVLEAGGPTRFAAGNRAKLYRKLEGEVKVYPIRLDDILNKGRLQTNYTLAPSDIVTIPERRF